MEEEEENLEMEWSERVREERESDDVWTETLKTKAAESLLHENVSGEIEHLNIRSAYFFLSFLRTDPLGPILIKKKKVNGTLVFTLCLVDPGF